MSISRGGPARRRLHLFLLAGGFVMSLPAISVQAQQGKPKFPRLRSLTKRSLRNSPPKPNRVQTPGTGTHATTGIVPHQAGMAAVDPRVWPLLTKMYRPTVNYQGIEVSNAHGMSSEETVIGDTSGRIRREYNAPPQFQGDIILTAPNQYYKFLSRARELYVAHWPMEQGDKLARLRALAKTGRLRIQLTGEEMVAGRSAAIVNISELSGGEESEARRVLYVDKETGILLRMDRYNSTGQQISSTYLKNVTTGVTIEPKAFDPRSLPSSALFPLFPDGQPMFTSVEQARSHAPFAIKEPTQFPNGYALDGVWVFGDVQKQQRVSVLLRYSSGVNHFSLFETLVPPNKQSASPLPRPGMMRPRRVPGGWHWRESVPEGELNLIYTGHLPEADFQTLQSSVR